MVKEILVKELSSERKFRTRVSDEDPLYRFCSRVNSQGDPVTGTGRFLKMNKIGSLRSTVWVPDHEVTRGKTSILLY